MVSATSIGFVQRGWGMVTLLYWICARIIIIFWLMESETRARQINSFHDTQISLTSSYLSNLTRKKLKSRDRKTKTRRIRSEKEKGRNSKIEYPRLRLSNRGIVIRLVNTVALPVIARVIASGGKLAREWSGALLRLRKYMWSTILISGARCSLCIDNPVFDIFGRESAKIMPPGDETFGGRLITVEHRTRWNAS